MILYHPTYRQYGIDASGKPVSTAVSPVPRPLAVERRREKGRRRVPRVCLRWCGHTLKVRLSDFARECREGVPVG